MAAGRAPEPLLVLGLGNVLCRDDGLGVAAVNLLSRHYEIPLGLRVLDGGTLGLALMSHLRGAEQLLIVDAIRGDGAPGSFVRIEGEDVAPAVQDRLSVHQIGVADLLDGLRLLNAYPRRLLLLGLVPESIELGAELSPAVGRQLPSLVERIVEELRDSGYRLRRKRKDAPVATWDLADIARPVGL